MNRILYSLLLITIVQSAHADVPKSVEKEFSKEFVDKFGLNNCDTKLFTTVTHDQPYRISINFKNSHSTDVINVSSWASYIFDFNGHKPEYVGNSRQVDYGMIEISEGYRPVDLGDDFQWTEQIEKQHHGIAENTTEEILRTGERPWVISSNPTDSKEDYNFAIQYLVSFRYSKEDWIENDLPEHVATSCVYYKVDNAKPRNKIENLVVTIDSSSSPIFDSSSNKATDQQNVSKAHNQLRDKVAKSFKIEPDKLEYLESGVLSEWTSFLFSGKEYVFVSNDLKYAFAGGAVKDLDQNRLLNELLEKKAGGETLGSFTGYNELLSNVVYGDHAVAR